MNELLDATAEALRTHLSPGWTVLIVSALPIFEIRGGVLVGLLLFRMPVADVMALGFLGNIISVSPPLVFLDPLSKWLYSSPFADRILHRLFAHTRKRADQVNKWGMPGLVLLTSIPLPGFGAWTAVVIAFLLRMRWRRALVATYAGILISGLIVAVLTLGGMAGADHLRGAP
jgi:uncharacterized membrane protein